MMTGDESSLFEREQVPGPVKQLVFAELPRRGRLSLDGQTCRLTSLAATLSINLCHSQAYRDQILKSVQMLLVTEGASQRIDIRDGLTFFHARPAAGYDIVARVKLLPVVATLPSVPELSAAQHLALGFGRLPNEALADKISFDGNKLTVRVPAARDQAALEKHKQELSQLDAKIKASMQVAAAKNAERIGELLQFLDEHKAALMEEQQSKTPASERDPDQDESKPDDFLQLLERGVAQEMAIINRADTRQRGDRNAVAFQGYAMDEKSAGSRWVEAKNAGRTEWGIEHEPIHEVDGGMDQTPFPLRRFVVPGLDEDEVTSLSKSESDEDVKEAEEAVDPSTLRSSLYTDGDDMISFELPTQSTEVILEESVSMEQMGKKKLKQRALRNFKATWPGATFEPGVAWAVMGTHMPLTAEEAKFAETGYLKSLRVSDLEEFDFSMPAEQPAAWAVVVPDGVFDIIARDEATEAQLAVHSTRAAHAAADLAAAAANRRARLATHFNSAPPSAEFLAERLAPSEADMPAIIDAHTTQRQAEQALVAAAARELIEFAVASNTIDPQKMAALFDRKGTPPREFLETNWPIDEAAFARAIALKRPYKEVKAAMDTGEDLGDTEERDARKEAEGAARKAAKEQAALEKAARRQAEKEQATRDKMRREQLAAEARREARQQRLQLAPGAQPEEAPISQRLALAIAAEQRARENYQRNPPYEKGHFQGVAEGAQSEAINRFRDEYAFAVMELKRARLSPTWGEHPVEKPQSPPPPSPPEPPPKAEERRVGRGGFLTSCCGSPPSR